MKKNKILMRFCQQAYFLIVLTLFFVQTSFASAYLQLASQNQANNELFFDSVFIDGNLYIKAFPNETVNAHFVFKNTGQEIWGSVKDRYPVFLGIYDNSNFYDFSNKFKNWGWSNKSKIRMTEQFFNKDTGEYIAIFSCEMTAPNKPGKYSSKMQLIVESDEYSSFFGDQIEMIFDVLENQENISSNQELININTFPDQSVPVLNNINSISGEIQRVTEAKNEITNYERQLEEKLKILEDYNREIEEKMKNTMTTEEKEEIVKELELAREEKEKLNNQLQILQNKVNKDSKFLSADMRGKFDDYLAKSSDVKKEDITKLIIISIIVFFITFFGLEYIFSHFKKTPKK